MIIVRISGGIGNQMFQYALGRTLALKNNAELKLDISSYSTQRPDEAKRSFTLGHFNIAGKIAVAKDFRSIGIVNPLNSGLYAKFRRKLQRFIDRNKPLTKKRFVIEKSFYFNPEILDIKDNCFLSGVWQTEKYFKSYAQQIRQDLTLKLPLSTIAARVAHDIETSESVSVHIRRGDQVHDPRLAKKQGLLSLDYYTEATSFLGNKFPTAHFFVFSDEIEWVKQNLNLGKNVTYVSTFKLPDYEEIILMSKCKHNIVAKSSYSWWGAWLNQNPDKTVIVPRERFGSLKLDDRDLTPEGWLHI